MTPREDSVLAEGELVAGMAGDAVVGGLSSGTGFSL